MTFYFIRITCNDTNGWKNCVEFVLCYPFQISFDPRWWLLCSGEWISRCCL